MSGRCAECGVNFPLAPATICHPCLDGYKQEQEEEKEQDQGLPPLATPAPPPACKGEVPELYRLLAAHRDGQLEPEHVALGKMPPHAGAVMRNIADHLQLLFGLRRAAGEHRPLPFAVSLAVKAGLANDAATASNALNALVRGGVLDHVGNMPPLRPGADGTKLYAPPIASDKP